MKRFIGLSLPLLLFASSCARAKETSGGGDPNGTWVGDFGPAFYDRNTISLELHWDGTTLTGMIRPGVPGGRMYRNFAGFPIENPQFDAKSGAIQFEATYRARNRHYFIEGKIDRNTLTGTWNRPDDLKDGDFKLIRKPTT